MTKSLGKEVLLKYAGYERSADEVTQAMTTGVVPKCRTCKQTV
jgi:hypothetical protein